MPRYIVSADAIRKSLVEFVVEAETFDEAYSLVNEGAGMGDVQEPKDPAQREAVNLADELDIREITREDTGEVWQY